MGTATARWRKTGIAKPDGLLQAVTLAALQEPTGVSALQCRLAEQHLTANKGRRDEDR
jgi:hypothetical protein